MGLPLLAVNLAATAASAAVTPDLHVVCNLGQTRITWSQVSKPWVVTHATQYSNWQSKTSTATRSTTNVRQVTASASVTTGVTVSESTLIESLQSDVSLTLKVAGTSTTTNTESFSTTFAPYTIDVVFDAVHEVKGSYTHYKCSADKQSWDQNGTGTAHSWTVNGTGVVACPQSRNYVAPPAGTAAAAALAYC